MTSTTTKQPPAKTLWGPPTWQAIHYVAVAYPDKPTPEDVSAYRAFYASLSGVLPCLQCAKHYGEHLAAMPLDDAAMTDSASLFAWTVRMHNRVNKSLGKPEMSLDDALRMYETKNSGASIGPTTNSSQNTIEKFGSPSCPENGEGKGTPRWRVFLAAALLFVALLLIIVVLIMVMTQSQ